MRLCDFPRKIKHYPILHSKKLNDWNEISKIVLSNSRSIRSWLIRKCLWRNFIFELNKENLKVERQKALPVIWKNKKINLGFRADLIVENKVILELKSVEKIALVHPKQLLTYLKVTNLKLGLLINFNEALIKNGITRIVNNL